MRRHANRESTAGLVVSTAGIVLGLVAVYAAAPLSGAGQAWGVVVGLAAMLTVVPVLVRRVRAVLESARPLADAVAAIAVIFTMIIFGTASTYFALASSNPGQFEGLETKIDAAYFAVVVISTVGFGDIAPVGQAARLVTTLHIVVNVTFIGVALRLVTWATRRRLGDPPS